MDPGRSSISPRSKWAIAIIVPLIVVAGTLTAIVATSGGGGQSGSSHDTDVGSSAANGNKASGPVLTHTSKGVAIPAAAGVTASCELPDPSKELGPAASLPAQPITRTIRPAGGIWTMSVTSNRVYVVNGDGLLIYNLAGSLLGTYPLPHSLTAHGDNEVSAPIVDPSGNAWISSYYGQTVVEIGPRGNIVRTLRVKGDPLNSFGLRSPKGAWELGVTTLQPKGSSLVYDEQGSRTGSVPLRESPTGFTSPGPHGDILYTTGRGLVQTWNPTGTRMLSEFGTASGTAQADRTGGPLAFYYADQATYDNGTVYAADGPGDIIATDANGLVEGSTSLGTTLGNGLDVTGYLGEADGDLYVETGTPFDQDTATISLVPTSTLSKYLDAPSDSSDVLGWGAGLVTGVEGDYFRPGKTVTIHAQFASWWTSLASHLQLTYRVWDEAAILAGTAPKATTMRLPSNASALRSIGLTLSDADKSIGPHQIEAELYETSGSSRTLVGTTCLPYTVGATGDHLDLTSLPPSTGSGGPSDNRGVALNAQLGLTGLRNESPVGWSTLLPDCNASAPTAATCGSSALDLKGASTIPFKAAHLADKDHVRYWLQVSGGDAVSLALVKSGYWGQDVQQLVKHYSSVPKGCQECAPVTAWEPWNEANNTGWSDAAAYVSDVLEPFYNAVKAVDTNDTVLGGTSLGVAISWWQALIAAHGLQYMTVAAVHPYPGNNDSWEEDGIETQLKQLEGMLGGKPLWLSEVGWWSDGEYDYLDQADAVARAMVWQKLLGIPVWNYFIDEGEFDNPTSVSYSLIQADDNNSSGDDYVKPAALSVMTGAHLLADRKVIGQVPTGIPQTYSARFGPAGGGGDHAVTAVWSDGLATTGSVSITGKRGTAVPVTITTEYGATSEVSLKAGRHYALSISDQLVYLTYPTGHTLRIAPTERYGADLALASSGAKATASSGNASAVLVDPSDATNEGEGWTSSPGDHSPSITVRLARTTTINRVLVDTQSLGSTAPGLRDYTVAIETRGGVWKRVAKVTDQFRNHIDQVGFDPVAAQAVRIRVSAVDFGGYAGGGLPSFCTVSACVPTAFVHAIEVYAGSSSAAAVSATRMPRLG
jgi:F5/8 type C domain